MATRTDYLGGLSGVWVDPAVADPSINCGNQNTVESHACGSVALRFSCAGPSEITFEFDVIAEQGHNNLWLAVDEHASIDGHASHIPQRAQRWTVERTPDEGPACDSVNGIRGADVCCPASCGHCGHNFNTPGGEHCAQLDPTQTIPGDTSGHSSCCIEDIERSGRICDAAAGIMAPCISSEAFEWRANPTQLFVEAGDHVLEVIAGHDAGTKIRNARFVERGSCGFTDTRPVDAAAIAAETAECQGRLPDIGALCAGVSASVPVPGLTGLSLPNSCSATCAQEYLSFHADCRQLLEADGVRSRGLHVLDMFLDSCNTAPPAPPDVPPLDTAACTAQFAGITAACCTPAKYCNGPTGIPTRCTATCVDPYLAFHRDCYPTLQAVQNVDITLYDELHDLCVVTQNRGGGH